MTIQTEHPVIYDRSDVAVLIRLAEWRGRAILRPSILVVATLVVAYLIIVGLPDFVPEIAAYAAVGGMVGYLLLIAPSTGSRIEMRRMRRSGGLVEQGFEISDDAFVTRNVRGESRHNWSSIRKVETTQERLFVFVSERCAFIVPQRAFGAEMSFDAFANEAKNRWQDAQRSIAQA